MRLFDGMEVFARVVEAGSFTAAAAQLGVTKSSVSETVRRLEDRIGVRLLDRTTRRLAPTPPGQAFYARCRRAIEEAASGRAEARALHAEPAGRLRVAGPEAFSRLHLTPVIARMIDEGPALEVELVEGVGAVDLVEAGIDLAVRIAPQPAENLVVRRIGTSRVIVAAAPAYLERHGAPEAPEGLAGHRTIGFAPLHWAREWRFEGPAGPVAVEVRPALLTHSTETLKAAALEGVGLVAMPQWALVEELKSGALVQVMTGCRAPESGIYAVYPSNRLMAAKVKRFADLVAQRLKRLGL